MKAEEYFEKHKHLLWLEHISQEYKEDIAIIERELDHFTIVGVGYNARGDTRVMDFNPHRTIKPRYILDGLKEALQGLEIDIKKIKEEISSVIVEL